MGKEHTGYVFTLANKITIARILLVPVFVLMLLYYTAGLGHGDGREMYRWAALVVFSVAALTDALDGYYARSRNEITHLGRILDPLADKSLLLSAIIILTRFQYFEMTPHFPLWFTLLVVSRDAVVVIGAFIVHALSGELHIQPRMCGKIATVLQMAGVVWVLSGYVSQWFYALVVAAAVFTGVAGGQYVFDGLRQLEQAYAKAHVRQRDGKQ